MRNLLVIAFVLSACGHHEDNREVVYRVQFFCGNLAWDLRSEAKAYRAYVATDDAPPAGQAADITFIEGGEFGRRTHDGRVATQRTLQRELLFCSRALGHQSDAVDNEVSTVSQTMWESDDPKQLADTMERFAALATEIVTPSQTE
jgi:hypothetical protein